MEKAINFKVNEELYKAIKVKVALNGKSMKDYIVELIKKDLENEQK